MVIRSAVVTLALMLVLPAGAGALDSGGGAWTPGQVLIRFQAGVGRAERDKIADKAHVTLEAQLPVVPNLWAAIARGNVPSAVGALDGARGVDYAQPDYVVDDHLEAAPQDPEYWPNDPYFWPAKFANPNRCELGAANSANTLSGWPYWPQGINLTDSAARLGATFNPLPRANQAAEIGGNDVFANYRSIDVLPVWNLLRDHGRLARPQPTRWTAAGIERFGVAVMDTGISNHPDVAPQVAAEFSTVRAKVGNGPDVHDQITEFYTDNRDRNDIGLVRAAVAAQRPNLTIAEATRSLFALDDTNVLTPTTWSPLVNNKPSLPTGCDGHGTGVASIIGAETNNHIGTAGVGYDVPLIGLRAGMPWDAPGSQDADDQRQPDALKAWQRSWQKTALESTTSDIDQLEIVKALRIPVLNMSFGSEMLTEGKDSDGHERPVIHNPAVADALARTLSTGHTLGVTVAGNDGERYGTGRAAVGHRHIQYPCGLKLMPKLAVWTSPNSHTRGVVSAAERWKPEIDWARVQLLCVAATTTKNSQLWAHSGRGSAAVQLAAPGANIAVATRAGADPSASSYTNDSGTSLAAPMVAGAAALLRIAAPGAPIQAIRSALLNGARPSPDRASVAYGSLDVACSLHWLYVRRREGWHMIPIGSAVDEAGYADFAQATKGCSRPPQFSVKSLTETTSETYTQEPEPLPAIVAGTVNQDAESNSSRWSDLLQPGSGATKLGYRPAFPIGRGAFSKPMDPAALTRRVYRLGLVGISCPTDYAITGVNVAFANLIKPHGWVFPTDEFAPPQRLQLAVVVDRPWFESFLASTLKVNLSARCEYYPPATR